MLPLDHDAALEHIIRKASRMILSDRGVELIALFEGFSPILYDDPAGNATIGFGFLVHLGPYHRDRGVCAACDSYRGGITEDQGKTLLREKAQTYADCMERSTAIQLNANEHAALTSFTYNLGCGGYVNSSVRVAVNARGDVCSALKQYVYGSNGIAYAGLLRRRAAECELFNTPVTAEEDDMPLNDADKVSIAQLIDFELAKDDRPLTGQQKRDTMEIMKGALEIFRIELAKAGQLPPAQP